MINCKDQEPEFCLIYSQFFWLPIILKIILNSFGYLLFLKLFQNNISRPIEIACQAECVAILLVM